MLCYSALQDWRRSAGCSRIESGLRNSPQHHPAANPGLHGFLFVDGRVKPGHDGLKRLSKPSGHPAGPGPLKINEALVPPNPNEFDST